MKVRPQVNIIVEATEKKRKTWVVKVKYRSHPDDPSRDAGYAILPGDFRRLQDAREIALVIGDAYEESGCSVATDASGKHKWRET